MHKLKEYFERLQEKPQMVLIIFGVAFFFLYSWLYAFSPAIYNSPDETATAYFTSLFIQQSVLSESFEPNPHNVIRPRSVNILGDTFVPGGFIGLPIALGFVGKVFGLHGAIFLPALLAIIAVILSYRIFSSVFTKEVAFFSSLSFFFLPQWWHYASKGFLPNVLFISCLIIAVACFLSAQKRKSSLYHQIWLSILSGTFLIVSFSIRPNELWWVGGVLLILFLFYRKKIQKSTIGFSLLAFVLPVLYLFFVQSQTYGGALLTGYDQLQATQELSIYSRVFASIFPFGIDLIQSGKSMLLFLFQLFWWQMALILIGFVSWVKNPIKSIEQKIYTLVFVLVSTYLFIYYGAWIISDDLDANRISIGISYIRYWLPFFILSIPFMILGLQAIAMKTKKAKTVFTMLFIGLMLGHSIFVFQGKDGLRKIHETIVNYKEIQNEILISTENNAIIIGERIDKVIWPKRQVIHFQDQDFSFISQLPEVLEHYPAYWLTLLPYDHVVIWEQTVFAQQGLQLLPVDFSQDGYALYKIDYVENF